MSSLLRRRPSPALVISVIALFVSLSGVSYGVATAFIDSREIKNNTVRSLDIRNNEIRTRDLRNNQVRGIDIRNSTIRTRDVGLNALTGNDVNESSFGEVPRAATAGSADSAGTAGSVGGVTLRKIAYSAQQGTGFAEVLNVGGLRLEARCTATGALEVRAEPLDPDSELSSEFPGTAPFVVDGAGDAASVIAYADPDGSVVTIEALTREDPNDVRGTADDCGFFGVANASG